MALMVNSHHGHDHQSQIKDLGPKNRGTEANTSCKSHHQERPLIDRAVAMHLFGDVANDLGVIVAAVVMTYVKAAARYYADPVASLAIGAFLFISGWPIGKHNLDIECKR